MGEAKERLGRDPRALLHALRVKFSPAGAKYVFVQPPHAAKPACFWVALHDGSWRDEYDGKGGDVIALIMRIRNESFVDAKAWAWGYLGWGESQAYKPPSSEELAKMKRQEAERAAKRKSEAERKSLGLFHYWRKLPLIDGTAAETYLRHARKIPLDRLGRMPHSLRFEAKSEHEDVQTGECTPWPAMVSLMSKGSAGVALHRTWLKPDGSDKAPVYKPKKMFGPKMGGAIRLWHGAGGFRPSDAIKRGVRLPCFLGEGIETVLTAAAAVPGYRAEATGDLGNMRHWIWPEYVSDVIVLKENDLHPQAIASFDVAIAHLRAQAATNGGRVFIEASDVGSDFNDYLKDD